MHGYDLLNRALGWKLLRGSHTFPGPDGGTCINEAAIVAAGFPYTAVESINVLPACFCPVLSHAALWLNDNMNDEPRQKLIPFVPRLAGSKDEGAEAPRSAYIITRIVGGVLRPAMSEADRSNFVVPWTVGELVAGFGGIMGITEPVAQGFFQIHFGKNPRWDLWLEALDGAFRIGKQAEPIAIDLIAARAAAAKRRAVTLAVGND